MAAELKRYVEYHRAAAQVERDRSAVAATALRTRLPALVGGLVARGARRVWLFGSLASGTIDERSDVDIAVEGLPIAAHFEAMAWAAHVMGRTVDLVYLETAPPTLRARIEACGEVLHDER